MRLRAVPTLWGEGASDKPSPIPSPDPITTTATRRYGVRRARPTALTVDGARRSLLASTGASVPKGTDLWQSSDHPTAQRRARETLGRSTPSGKTSEAVCAGPPTTLSI
jgi:hypothetical protein